jgi:hypothetical protein
MGYRNYLNKLPRSVYEEYKDLTAIEIEEKYGEDFYIGRDHGLVELHCLGKYCDFDIHDLLTRFYKEEMDFECDVEFSLASKEVLLRIIEHYREYVEKFYVDLAEKPIEKHREHALSMAREWSSHLTPYSLDGDEMVSSWKYEYVIFELVRIYREFDWENDVLIYTGG